eukprot:3981303-Pyramimonas_sp.AAC.1
MAYIQICVHMLRSVPQKRPTALTWPLFHPGHSTLTLSSAGLKLCCIFSMRRCGDAIWIPGGGAGRLARGTVT